MATPAAAAATAPPAATDAPAKDKKKRGKLVPVIAGVVLLAASGGGAWYFMNRGSHEAAPAGEEGKPAAEGAKTDAIFVPLEAAFVVNLEDEDAMRFMQVEVQVVTRDAKAVDLIKANMPILRNRLMLLFSGQHYRDLNTRAAKEKLQADALAEAQKAMIDTTGKAQIEALYFTSLVMQ